MEVVSPDDRETAEPLDGAFLTQGVAGDRMSIQHFHFKPGAEVPEHSHPHEQVGFVHSGALTFIIDGEEIVVGPGESFALASEEAHAEVNQGDIPAQGIDVFSPPRPNPPDIED